jgi:hypothetical protein
LFFFCFGLVGSLEIFFFCFFRVMLNDILGAGRYGCVCLLHLLGMGICRHIFCLSVYSFLLFISFPFKSALGGQACGVGLVLALPVSCPALTFFFGLEALFSSLLFSSSLVYALQASVWSGLVGFIA